MNQITTIKSIHQIPKKKWDALADDNVFASHGWLLTVEKSLLKEVTPIYFLYQENRCLSGAAVCYPVPENVKMFSPDNLLFGRFKKFVTPLRLSFLPTLMCGPLKAYGKHILLGKSIDQSKKGIIVNAILDAAEAEAKKRKLSLSFSRTLEQETILLKQLRQRGYLKTADLPLAYMDISWDSFDAYKKHIRKRSLNMKKNIAIEINRNKKAGVIISKVKNLTEQENRLYALLNGNCIKHNKASLPFHENFLSQLKKNFGDDLVIYRSIKNNRISGMGIMLRSGDAGYLSFVGVDHHLSQNDATFFNMLFYRPIADAITEDIKRLYYGNAMYDMKIRRGCKIEKAFFFYKPCRACFRPAVTAWFYLHKLWYQKKLPQPQDLSSSL